MENADTAARLMDVYRALYARFGPQHWWPARTRFEVIVGMVLTQNTAWTNVERAIANLRRCGALAYAGMTRLPESGLAELIRPAGYYRVKARRLKNVLAYLRDACGGNLTRLFRRSTAELRPELLAVNGLGPESVDSILLYAGSKPVFVVDAYTKRIFSRLGLVARDAAYHDIQRLFVRNLTTDARLFNEYHALIVTLGKEHCRTRPVCRECPVRIFCTDVKHNAF